jgi:hypothetical protein
LVVLTWSVAAGCASEDSARREREAARNAHSYAVQPAKYEDDGDSPEMNVSGEEGTLNEADVQNALKDHFGEIRDCLHLGRRSMRSTGRLVLRLFVDGKGEVQDVTFVEGSLGNPHVERCIADICLGVMFDPPAGHKATTFDYPVELRPARVAARKP